MDITVDRTGGSHGQRNGSAEPMKDTGYLRRVGAIEGALRDRFGCLLMENHGLEDRYGVTLVLERLPQVDTVLSIGVAIAREDDDLNHQAQCADTVRRQVVSRLLYLELGDEAEEIGAPSLVYTALSSFLFDQHYRELKTGLLRFASDGSYAITPLEDNLRRLQREDARRDLPEEPLDGMVVAYFADKGFGFIEAAGHEKFFFHIAHVDDDALRTRLPSFLPGERLAVAFRYGGHDGKKYPKAVDIGSAVERTDASDA